MGTTPIYGFPYPDPSDLVANYPALGQDLAEDIETVIDGLGAGALSLVTSQSFSAVASVSVNNCFTSTYANYKILFFSTNSAAAFLNFRYRASSTDNTSAVYYMRGVNQGAVTSTEANTVTLHEIVQGGVQGTSFTMDLFNPQASNYKMNAYIASGIELGVLAQYRTGTGIHGSTTAFDGFTLSASTGNMTGTLRVYGYQNS
jgi:hypothetical protein